MENELKPCPVCGGRADVIHLYDTYDRADYGFWAGCMRAKFGDGIHDDLTKVQVRGLSKQAVIDEWNRIVSDETAQI